ncbi:7-deoxyloganetin glucosyltransferase-like isoform X3 [Lolium rigidum]|uniref:7-deoxyloganetin glucosyltransferase-like isoform X3 n=1 Tax=Lolium rigidum TaxID=89674 RepID=UPI001F5D5F90|nr:7-deoxyloganetin glucosyltransferase-like isoform X3 [Lolium rigidum]
MGSMGGAGVADEKPHAVCLPFPAQGHITPMFNVAKLLHARGFHVTFVNSEYNHARLVRTRGAAALAGFPGFRFDTIPDGMPAIDDYDDDITQDIPKLCKSTTETCLEPFRRLLSEINSSASAEGHPPVTCVISDVIMGFSMDAAKELGLPYVQLSTASAVSYLAYHHYNLLIDRGIFPLKGTHAYVKLLTDGYLNTPVEDVPGLRSMRLRDFPSFIHSTDPEEFMVGYAIKETARTASASAVIINSFADLEGQEVDAMETLLGLPKVYMLGPLPLVAAPQSTAISGLSLWKEQEECLQWLHDKDPGSVVYVNFGSIVVMTSEQLVEFAWGLANSGREFIWIIRRDLVKGDAAVLPPEFLAMTAERGFMASWCPQQEVLNHPTVGAFLTHSGWNSALESICAGVPVLSWPFFADQQTNCRYQCNEWGVGMEIDSNVQRDVVSVLIMELMEGEKGKAMRKRAEEWREKAVMAAEPDGSAHRNFDELVRDVLLAKH